MVKEFVVKTGIIEETKALSTMDSMYSYLDSLFRQWKNISLEFVDIERENLQRTLDEGSPEGAEWLFFPAEMSLFSVNRSITSPLLSLAGKVTSTYILSATPTKRTVPTLAFLVMTPSFVCCLFASLITVSALMAVIIRLERTRVWSLRDFGHQIYENLWITSLLFFFEPFNRPAPRILSWRLTVSVWLVAIAFIYIVMCSYLNSKFTKTEYLYVDSMLNLPRYHYDRVMVVEDYVEDSFVSKMAEIDDKYRELKKRMRRANEVEFLEVLTTFDFIETNQYIMLAEVLGKIGLNELYDLTSEAPTRGLVSFSEPLYSTFIVFPIASNATPKTVDAIIGFCLMEMEMKIMANYFNEMDFWFFGMKWTQPVDTFKDTSFGDVKSVVDVFLIGCFIAALVVSVEYCSDLDRQALANLFKLK